MACGGYVVTILNWTPRFDWYLIPSGSKSKPHKDTCLKEIGLRHQAFITTQHSIVNTIRRTYVSS